MPAPVGRDYRSRDDVVVDEARGIDMLQFNRALADLVWLSC